MSSSDSSELIPARFRSIFSVVATVLAAVLYAVVLGGAVVRTFLENDPQFSDTIVRAVGVLSGLVGAVVTTGFARSQPAVSAPVSARHPLGGDAPTGWSDLKPPSLIRRKLLGLADTLGFRRPTYRRSTRRSGQDASEPSSGDDATPVTPTPHPASGLADTVRAWIGGVYFVIYFVVGIAAFLVSLLRASVPDIVANAGWVWLGTVLSSAYAFLGLNNES
jgi:hypothetical protein